MILHFVLPIYHIPINYFQASLKWKDWVIKFIFIISHIYISLDIEFLIMQLLLYFLVKKFDVKIRYYNIYNFCTSYIKIINSSSL